MKYTVNKNRTFADTNEYEIYMSEGVFALSLGNGRDYTWILEDAVIFKIERGTIHVSGLFDIDGEKYTRECWTLKEVYKNEKKKTPASVEKIKRCCSNCHFNENSSCIRYPPVVIDSDLSGKFPSLYNRESHTLCGEWREMKGAT